LSVPENILNFVKLLLDSKVTPEDIRLLWVTEKKLIYVNKGNVEYRSYSFDISTGLQQDRGKILDIFAELEFVIIELIRLKIQGYQHENSKMFLSLLNAINMNRMLRTLRDFEVIDTELYKLLSKIFDVRNSLAHYFSIYEVEYNSRPLFHTTDHSNFELFKTELNDTWKKLIKVYEKEERVIDIEALSQKIKDCQPKS